MIYEVIQLYHMNAKVDALYKKIDDLSITSPTPTFVASYSPANFNYEIYGINKHMTNDCHQGIYSRQCEFCEQLATKQSLL